LENAPVVFLRNTTAPPAAAELPAIRTLTLGEVAPDGLVMRMRHGEGAHETNRAVGLMLLLICNSTFIVSQALLPAVPVSGSALARAAKSILSDTRKSSARLGMPVEVVDLSRNSRVAGLFSSIVYQLALFNNRTRRKFERPPGIGTHRCS
jgi:hypothetical protein